MPTVTRLERQKKQQDRVNVYLDGIFAFGLNEVDAASLRTGQELSDDAIDELRYKDTIVKAINKAVDLLARRPRSTQEIRQKLASKDYPPAAIEAAIVRLERMGYLDDRSFATFWIENRNRHKPRGPRALRYELRNKGIADRIIDELLDDLVDEQEAAYDAARARIRRMRGKTEEEFKRKVGAFLQRRGFGYETVRQALDRWQEELLLEDPDYFSES